MKILIWSPRFINWSGGITALHKLCHILRGMGVEAYMWIAESNVTDRDVQGDWVTPIGNGKMDPHDCTVVYPEIAVGNPIEAKRIVRWILGHPQPWAHFADNETTVYFQSRFVKDPDPAHQLSVFERWPTVNISEPLGNRSGGCFTVRKGASTPRIPETDGMQEFGWRTIQEHAQIFRSKEIFYSYDVSTFLSIQAALCGCTSVVVPKPGLSAVQWRNEHVDLRYGVAYGTKEIPWAKKTQHLVKDHLDILEQQTLVQVNALLARLGE